MLRGRCNLPPGLGVKQVHNRFTARSIGAAVHTHAAVITCAGLKAEHSTDTAAGPDKGQAGEPADKRRHLLAAEQESAEQRRQQHRQAAHQVRHRC